MNIGIDIDDTIANSTEEWIKYALEYEKKHPEIIKEYNKKFEKLTTHKWLEEIFKWNEKDKINFFREYTEKAFKMLEIKQNADIVINRLYEQGDNIYIVPARHDMDDSTDVIGITKEWLLKNNIKYTKIFFNENTKLDICKKEKIDIFIDDSYTICKELSKNKIPVLLMKSKYNNIEDSKIPKVENWDEIYDRIGK